ncbi:MAG: putative transrane protein [Polaromonas sp.]|jgi:hypothetical protein|nr:putative transrane protein [Polaromonas sp.]
MTHGLLLSLIPLSSGRLFPAEATQQLASKPGCRTGAKPRVMCASSALLALALLPPCLMLVPFSGWAQAVPLAPTFSGTAVVTAPKTTTTVGALKSASPPGQKSAANAGKALASRPLWSELTDTQQQALKPLAASWDTIREAQKRKWLEVSKNYRTLTPDGQAVLHSRMNEWVTLSPDQRAQARLNFAKTTELSRELTPDEKKAKWQAYQALDADEKARLAANAAPRPAGAATAVKPVAPQKLAILPARPGQHGSPPAGAASTPKIPAPAGN